MSGHTPTEWKWDGDTFVYALNLEGSNRFFCGIQPGWATQGRTRTDHEELIANARLIAAAPTMYDYITKCAEAGDGEAIQLLDSIHASR